MILVVGATGSIGREVVRMLVQRGLPVRALSRDVERARALPGWHGIDVVTGDPVQIGGELTASPVVRKLSFTGSTAVGRRLLADGAARTMSASAASEEGGQPVKATTCMPPSSTLRKAMKR